MSMRAFWALAPMFLVVLMVTGLAIGRYPIAPVQVIGVVLDSFLSLGAAAESVEQRVVGLVRAPRILLAATLGAGLGVGGAALQGIFRNPLIGPDIIGIAPGAAFGGALAILLIGHPAATIAGAFASGLLAIFVVSAVARAGGSTSTLGLVLAGVVVGAFFSALISLVTYLADVNSELPAILYWLLGSLSGANYGKLALAAGIALPAALIIIGLRFRINALALGDAEARGLGLNVVPIRWAVLGAVTVIVAAGVAVAGIIGWVGLVVPHLARLCVGPDHRAQLPAAALIGAALLVLVDTLARSLTAAEIPLSVLTALIGAPIFILVLRGRGRLGWGHG